MRAMRARGYDPTMTEINQFLLRGLQMRIASQPTKVNNNAQYAGSPMWFYCDMCGHLSDKLPESYACVPKKHCAPCLEVKAAHPGVSERTLVDMATYLPPLPP